ncbi:hypothetical protein AB0C93_11680 [Streptomyces sp. NPDC048518]|uniref:hypothetical protein n=1 Tax=Streptomyces sp. NPDC048518 TaxID=3155029 RepID=UPI0033D508B5
MRTLKRSSSTAVILSALTWTTALATATPAAAASYRCKTSTESVDDTAYDGFWADNWDFTVARRPDRRHLKATPS